MFGIFDESGSINQEAFVALFTPPQRLELLRELLRDNAAEVLETLAASLRDIMTKAGSVEEGLHNLLLYIENLEKQAKEIRLAEIQ